MHLNNWGVVALDSNPWQAPESHAKGLTGNVRGSPNFTDGTNITTSRLVAVQNDETGQLIARTASGSVYTLGEMAAEYEAAFPDGIERFKKAWGVA